MAPTCQFREVGYETLRRAVARPRGVGLPSTARLPWERRSCGPVALRPRLSTGMPLSWSEPVERSGSPTVGSLPLADPETSVGIPIEQPERTLQVEPPQPVGTACVQ